MNKVDLELVLRKEIKELKESMTDIIKVEVKKEVKRLANAAKKTKEEK